MRDVHRVSDLPDDPIPDAADDERANAFVPAYFTDYERTHDLPVIRPVQVRSVRDDDGLLRIEADHRTWLTRTLINATGTWTRPFIPYYPGAETFAGEQLHTADYPGPEHFRGKRVLVVGGGASAVQFIGALGRSPTRSGSPAASRCGARTSSPRRSAARSWQGRGARTPGAATPECRQRYGPDAPAAGARGRAARSVRTPADVQPHRARRRALGRQAGAFERVDVILWATGFRPAIEHLGPLHLRSPRGGIQLDGTRPWPTRASRWSATARPRARSAPTAPGVQRHEASRRGSRQKWSASSPDTVGHSRTMICSTRPAA